MSESSILRGFLLNYSFRDTHGRFEITLYAALENGDPLTIHIDTFRPLFFVSRSTDPALCRLAQERKELPLKAVDGTSVDCLYFANNKAAAECAAKFRSENRTLYESDIHPVDRFLMERFIAGGFEARGEVTHSGSTQIMRNPQMRGSDITPHLRVLSIDIETNAATNHLYSIACAGLPEERVFVIGSEPIGPPVTICPDEMTLLRDFFQYMRRCDPDIIIGWSVVDFDLRILQERAAACNIPFDIGRDKGARIVLNPSTNQHHARIPGRIVLDIPQMLRATYHTFEEYSLNFVASEMLGKTKTIESTGAEKIAEINRLFNENKPELAQYNLQDAILTKEIFDHAEILPNALERSKRSGLLLDRAGGSVAAFDFLYLPHLHRAGYVARDVIDAAQDDIALPGGYVLDPEAGLYENVTVLDFRSLYPSIIMTFKIDPLGLISSSKNRIKGPAGPSFATDQSILPSIIAQLMAARETAKQQKNAPLSQAIKILMNSFYGVLGARGCRFFSPDLAATITRTGQYILKTTIAFIESTSGCKVIYGDTDSLFVLLGADRQEQAASIGSELAHNVTAWLSVHLKEKFEAESALQLQYETHFRHFFVPSIRGSSQGSKKHYCGTIVEDGESKLVFKGMESARTDWTDLAKDFQHELYTRIFAGRPVEDLVTGTVAKVKRGELDSKLVYKKRLRKSLDEYTAAVPHHVQAARLLDNPGHLIRYYITVDGPQPIEKLTAPLDYNYYIDSQLRPIADSILEWKGLNFDAIVSGQLSLF